MRFLVDECTGPTVSRWLSAAGHDVFSVSDEASGATDDALLTRAFAEDRIIITNDKDFGELVFRGQQPHKGIVLLRLSDERPESKIRALDRLLAKDAARLQNHFTVVTESQVRISDD